MGAEDLGWEGWTVIATLIVAFILMGPDRVGPDITFTVLLAFYVASTILPIARASPGYSNTGLLTVVFLYPVAEGIYQTGALERIVGYLLGRSRSPFWGLVRMMIPCMFLSAFLNNTPVVSLLVPIIISWCRRTGVPVKKMLMPLSIAAVLGGTCTLIGTSTNLVVSGQQQTRYSRLKRFDDVVFKIFDIAPYGVPYAIWGFIFVITMQRWLLSGNSSRYAKNLLLALRVTPGSPSSGKTLLHSGLKHMQNLFVVAIVRSNEWIKDPHAEFVLQEGDIVYVAGELDQAEYYAEEYGLQLISAGSDAQGSAHQVVAPELDAMATHLGYTKLVQVTINPDADIIGATPLTAHLRRRLDISVIGLKRSAGRPDARLSELVFQAGDTLVVDAGSGSDTTSPEFTKLFKDVHMLKEGATREFVLGLAVRGRELVGQTVSEAGLRGIPGISVLSIDRQGAKEGRVAPDHETRLEEGDVIWVAADIEGAVFLAKYGGLELGEQKQVDKSKTNILYRRLVVAAVSGQSALVGQTVISARFRKKFDAVVVGVHREGYRMPLPPRDAVLQTGDVLLLSASPEFLATYRNDRNFVLLSDVRGSDPPKRSRALIALFLGTSMVLTQIIPGIRADKDLPEWIHLWPCSVLTFGLMLVSGCLSGDQARQSILWDVYLAIAGAFGVSAAMESTGVALEFAQLFIRIGRNIGGKGAALTSIYVATALLSEILTNNASGAIMYPIAAAAGDALGVEPRAMSVAIMLGASAGFINPFSYQTNMMVYTAGNYRTLEFVKFGVPFQAYLLIVAGFILAFYDNWQGVWIVSFIVCGAWLGVPLMWALLPVRFTNGVEEWVVAHVPGFRQKSDDSFSRSNTNGVAHVALSAVDDKKQPLNRA